MRVISLDLPRMHAGQQTVIDECKRMNVASMGRRFGKSTLGMHLLIDAMLHGKRVGWFAPTYKYLAEVWREIVALLAPLSPTINIQEKRIQLLTGGVSEFWSLEDPDAGRSRKYHRVIIDEAGMVRNLEQSWQAAIRPTLTDFKGDGWLLGTPKGSSGYFQKLYAKGQAGDPEWKSWRLPTISNPAIDPSEIEAARRDMPEAAFAQEYLGIPADDGGNPFGLAAIAGCLGPLSTDPPTCFGVDLAKSIDWSVICGLDDSGRVCHLERWQSDWGQTRRRVLDTIGYVPTLVDSTGVGDPIVEDLQRAGAAVESFKFSSSSKQQLMEGLAASIQRREIEFPDGWLRNELDMFEFEYRAGTVRYSSPSGMHDDGVCALALAERKRRAAYHFNFDDIEPDAVGGRAI